MRVRDASSDEERSTTRNAASLAEKEAKLIAAFIAGVVDGVSAQRVLSIEPSGAFAFDIWLNLLWHLAS